MRSEPTGLSWLRLGERPQVASQPGGLVGVFVASAAVSIGQQVDLAADFTVAPIGTTQGALMSGVVVGGERTNHTAVDNIGDVGSAAASTGQLALVCFMGVAYTGTSPINAVKSVISPRTLSSLRRLGAAGNGAGDDTAPLNTLLGLRTGNARGLDLGTGFYLVSSALSTIPGGGTVTALAGAGRDATQIWFQPTVSGSVLFNFDSGGSGVLLWRSSIRDLSIYDNGDTTTKTAIRLLETREFWLSKVHINFLAGGNSSIGLQAYGRDDASIEQLTIYAARPIVISKNPYASQQVGLDHWEFRDLTMYGNLGAGHPLIEVDPGCNLSSTHFTGRQSWIGGICAFSYDSTSDAAGGMNNVTFEGIRWEDGGETITKPTFNLIPNAAKTNSVVFRDCNISVKFNGGTPGTGIYLRNFKSVILDSVEFNGASGQTSFDIDACDELMLINCRNVGGITPRIANMDLIWSLGGTGTEAVTTAYYRKSSLAGVYKAFNLSGKKVRSWHVKINSDTNYILDVNAGSLGTGIVEITTAAGTGSVEHGRWTLSRYILGTSAVRVDDATTHAINARTLGSINVYMPGDDTITVYNGLPEARWFTIILEFTDPIAEP